MFLMGSYSMASIFGHVSVEVRSVETLRPLFDTMGPHAALVLEAKEAGSIVATCKISLENFFFGVGGAVSSQAM